MAIRDLVKNHGSTPLHSLSVKNVLAGMRGVPALLWEVSEVSDRGILFHGKSFDELSTLMPKWRDSQQPSPEAMIWYLYTASVPSQTQLENFVSDLSRRASLPPDVLSFVDSLSSHIPATTQLMMSFAALSPRSHVVRAINSGVPKNEMWCHALEDALDITARIPSLVGRIIVNKRGTSHGHKVELKTFQSNCDMVQNFAVAVGEDSNIDFAELIRLYWALHLEHGPSASGHTARKSSPYLTKLDC